MSTTKIQLDVVNGPSADRVIDALKYAFSNSDDRIVVEFTVIERNARLRGSRMWPKYRAQITGVSYESGAPGMFNLRMNIPGFTKAEAEGFYDANKRQGIFTLTRHR